jgi:uncharacterized protein
MRLELWVQPLATRPSVGGSHAGALVVRVVEPPERGRATAASVRALAAALGVPTASVAVVRGRTNRRKVVEVEVPEGDGGRLEGRLRELLEAADRTGPPARGRRG